MNVKGKTSDAASSNWTRPLKKGLQARIARLFWSKNAKPLDPNLRGALHLRQDRPSITGWAALIGDVSPRHVVVKIGSHSQELLADSFRHDLRAAGINEGEHSFSAPVPARLMDGRPHPVQLIDKMTGKVLLSRKFTWRADTFFHDFDSFLASSMTQPLFTAPFSDTEKVCLAGMENVATHLCAVTAKLADQPLVSVIMPVFNREVLVLKAIRSVLAQTYKNFEIVVVDDGSTDGTAAAVSGLDDQRIRLVRLSENQGQTIARNRAVAEAQGSIITYLDSDNHWDARYLAAVIGAFAELPKAGAVYSGLYLYHGASNTPDAVRYGHFNRSLLENRNYVDLNALAHRASVEFENGVFTRDLCRFVDYDLVLRLSEKYRLYSIPVVLCHYFYDVADWTLTKKNETSEDIHKVLGNIELRRNALPNLALVAPDKKQVTAIIPNWQSLDDLKDCLAGLTAQGWGDGLRIIVVDNASDPEVGAYLRTERDRGAIELIENTRNYGFTQAVNQGIAASAAGSDILIVNNDAVLRANALIHLQQAAYDLPQAGITVPRQILPALNKTIQIHVPFAQANRPCDVNLSAHHRNIAHLPLFHDGGPIELTYAPFFATYIRRDVIDRIGGLDAEHGRHYRSDRLYCDKMRFLTDRKIYYVPDALADHKLQAATDRMRQDANRSAEFDLLFNKNQWDDETAAELGFVRKPWDFP